MNQAFSLKCFILCLALSWGIRLEARELLPTPTPGASCDKSCLLNADCGLGGACEGGLCRTQTAYCADELWSANERGEFSNCGGSTCDTKTGLCRNRASQQLDCTFGYVLDTATQTCVPAVECKEDSPSCRILWNKWQLERNDYEARHPRPTFTNYQCQSCLSHSDCHGSEMCWNGQCKRDASYCSEQGLSVIMGRSGLKKSCGEYRCDPVRSECRTECQMNSDCSSGNVCMKMRCVSAPEVFSCPAGF